MKKAISYQDRALKGVFIIESRSYICIQSYKKVRDVVVISVVFGRGAKGYNTIL